MTERIVHAVQGCCTVLITPEQKRGKVRKVIRAVFVFLALNMSNAFMDSHTLTTGHAHTQTALKKGRETASTSLANNTP